MKIFFRNFGLLIIALVIFCVLLPIGVLYILLSPHHWSIFFLRLAIAVNQLGSVFYSQLFNNFLLRTKKGKLDENVFLFGDPDRTISETLGRNQVVGNLSKLGVKVADILDTIHENHCYKSIKILRDESTYFLALYTTYAMTTVIK